MKLKKSVAVLGLGKFGRSLSENLYQMGADVLAVDCNEELVNEFAGKCTSAVCANLTNEEEVAALGLKNMDIVVVAMGRNLAASILSIAIAKEDGVSLIVAKSSSERMSAILSKVGANKIIDPEGEGGFRSARILISSSFKDFFKLDDNMYMIDMKPRKEWIGKNLIELNLRKKWNVNIIAIRQKGQLWQFVDPSLPITEDCDLLMVMEKKHMKKWQ
ncbi:MAG: TrkA family potassium uptake protein [Lachnospiraceae bacterium]|nr:TrkA family potassium uptake protein [Lachnospiraceae bacterium]